MILKTPSSFKGLVFMYLILIGFSAFAQNYNMNNTRDTTCSGNFYDNGGPSGNHGDSGTLTKTFTSANGNRLRFAFSSFNTAGSSDRLIAYDGPNSSYPVLTSRAGSQGSFVIESTGNQITFVFSMFNNGLTAAGWAATISCTTPALAIYTINDTLITDCSGAFYDSGVNTASYSNNENKTTTISAGSGNLLKFTFVSNATNLASGDSLFVFDGPSITSTPLAVYVASSRFEAFTSSDTAVTFRFKSNASTTAAGWQALFECTQTPATPTNYNIGQGVIYTCGGNFYDDGGASGNHGDAGSHTQTFYSKTGSRIKFDFSQFNTAGASDILRIYDGPNTSYPLIATLSGSRGVPFSYESTGSSLTFTFNKFENSLTAAGWAAAISCAGDLLTVYSINDSFVSDCEGVFYDSGLNTVNYSNNEDKTTTISAGNGNLLKFTFTAATSLGAGDSLFIFDGPTVTSPPIAIFVASSRFETFTSSDTAVTFRFKSNASTTAAGWQALFECTQTPATPTNYNIGQGMIYTCGGNFYDDGGSSGNHGDAGSHTQTFHSSAGNRIKFNFTQFNTAGASDILRIYDGPNTSYPLIATLSGSRGVPFSYESTGSSLTFTFTKFQNSLTAAGWAAAISCTTPILESYTITDAVAYACEGMFYDNGGLFGNYTANSDDTITFHTDSGKFFVFNFVTANTTIETGDSLFVFDGNNTSTEPLGVFIKGSRIEKIVSSGSSITFRFKTDADTQASGWRASFYCTDSLTESLSYTLSTGVRHTCTGSFTDSGGSDANYADNSGSTQTIVSSSGCGIRFAFSQFILHASDNLRVYDGENTNAELIGTYTGTQNNLVLQSTGKALTFVFSTNNANTTNAGWNAAISCPITTPTPQPISNSPLCVGDTLLLSTNNIPNATFQWKEGLKNYDLQNPVIANMSIGTFTYDVVATIGECRSAKAPVTVSVFNYPQTPIVSVESTVCSGSNVLFQASTDSGASFVWTGPNGFSSTISNPILANVGVDASGNYELTVSLNGCSSSKSSPLVVYANPEKPTISPDDVPEILISSKSNFYQWFFENDSISGASEQFIMVSEQGNYKVAIIDSNGCSAMSDSYKYIITLTDEIIKSNVSVFPNPVSDGKLHIVNKGLIYHQASISNLDGTIVYQTNLTDEKQTVDLSNLQNGIYVLSLTTEDNKDNYLKIVKQ